MLGHTASNNLLAHVDAKCSQRGLYPFKRWAKWTITRLIVLTVILLSVGAVYQFAATLIDERKYQPTGKLFDVGCHQLHLNCTGEGDQTVILEAGLGGGVLDWSLVQPEISRFARVCSYDHAGAGWSEAGPQPRDSNQIVSELHRLLENAGLQPPFILVGHSLGGVSVQLYAARYPEDVAGLVLIDSSHEDQFLRQELPKVSPAYSYLMKGLAPVGVARLLMMVKGAGDSLPPEVGRELLALYSHSGHLYSVADELSNMPKSMEELRREAMRLGDKPLIVLTHGKMQNGEAAERAWLELQKDLASRSTRGRHIIAERSGHYIQFDEPFLVVDAIRQVLNDSCLTNVASR